MKSTNLRVKAKSLSYAQMRKYERDSQELSTLSTEALLARTRPMTNVERARWKIARQSKLSKRLVQKPARVLVRIDPNLLEEADGYARQHGLTRAELIANGLRSVMAE